MTYTVCYATLELYVRSYHRPVTIAPMELQTDVLSTLAECELGDVNYDVIVVTVTSMTSLMKEMADSVYMLHRFFQ